MKLLKKKILNTIFMRIHIYIDYKLGIDNKLPNFYIFKFGLILFSWFSHFYFYR